MLFVAGRMGRQNEVFILNFMRLVPGGSVFRHIYIIFQLILLGLRLLYANILSTVPSFIVPSRTFLLLLAL